MANVLIGTPNWVSSTYYPVTLSGGSWLPSCPISNLSTRYFAQVARSTSTALADTQVVVDLGKARAVRVVMIPRHNLSRSARYRIVAATAADFTTTIADTDWQPVWPRLYPYGSLPYGHPSWWSGTATDEEVAATSVPLLHIFQASVMSRYWRLEIDDRTNQYGYIDLSNLYITAAIQPSINMDWGVKNGWSGENRAEESLNGAVWPLEGPRKRTATFVLSGLSESEAYKQYYKLGQQAGYSDHIIYIYDPDDVVYRTERTFVATQTALGAYSQDNVYRLSTTIQLTEVVA